MNVLNKMPDGYQIPNPTVLPRTSDTEYKDRATFYFTPEMLLGLEVVMLKMRTEQGLKVGKSEIVRAALDFMVEDFNLNKGQSWIAQRLLAESERDRKEGKK